MKKKTYWLDLKAEPGKQRQFASLTFKQLKSVLRQLKGWDYGPIGRDCKGRRWSSSALKVHQYNLGANH